MHCRLLTQYAIIMVQFLAGLRKIKLLPAHRSNYSEFMEIDQFSILWMNFKQKLL